MPWQICSLVSQKPSMLNNVISNKISFAGSNGDLCTTNASNEFSCDLHLNFKARQWDKYQKRMCVLFKDF